MSRDIRVRVELRVGPFSARAGLVGLLLLACAGELGSESVSLTTYYPAPSGVYTQMITTQNTYLARDGGKVGIGTATPLAKLDVTGDINVTGNLLGNGVRGMIFGGAYEYYCNGNSGSCPCASGGVRVANPLTGGASCPAGYSNIQYWFFDSVNSNCLALCYR